MISECRMCALTGSLGAGKTTSVDVIAKDTGLILHQQLKILFCAHVQILFPWKDHKIPTQGRQGHTRILTACS